VDFPEIARANGAKKNGTNGSSNGNGAEVEGFGHLPPPEVTVPLDPPQAAGGAAVPEAQS
jgi:hypothetical protein